MMFVWSNVASTKASGHQWWRKQPICSACASVAIAIFFGLLIYLELGRTVGALTFEYRSDDEQRSCCYLVCGELLDLALETVVLAAGFHGPNRVVVGCSRLEVVHAHAEHGIGMARI